MTKEQYFRRYKKIYGISECYIFGHWERYAVQFDSLEDYEEWIKTEEYEFRERSWVKKSYLKKINCYICQYKNGNIIIKE